MTNVEGWVRDLTEKAIGPSYLGVGKDVIHPDTRTVRVVAGQYWGANGLSNNWTWREVQKDGSLGSEESGYGWPEGTIDLNAVLKMAAGREIVRVSHLEYDAHDICRHFHGEVLKRVGERLPAEAKDVLDAAFEEEIAKVTHVPYDSHEICQTFYDRVRENVAKRLVQVQEEEAEYDTQSPGFV